MTTVDRLYHILQAPVLTEKGTDDAADRNAYHFRVPLDANKTEIRQAIEQLLGSKVEQVRTTIAHGKLKRQGRYAGRRPDWKKAYVKLRVGQKMPEFLEGA